MAVQKVWSVLLLTTRNNSCPPQCGFQMGSCMEQDRNVIPLESWTPNEGNWRRRAILRSEDIARWLAHKWLAPGVGEALEGVQSDQSGKTWWWCHSELIILGIWRVLRQLLPGLLLWQPSQPSRKKLEEGAPLLCGRPVSEVGHREMGQGQQEHMGDLSMSGLGDSILHCQAKLQCSTVWSVHRSFYP
jgi:hypothetical protein